MCNPKAEANMVYNKVGAWPLVSSFPQEFIQNFHPSGVQNHHCLQCGRPLSYQEMHPGGKMPRYMCEPCYNQIVYSGPHRNCLTCGKPLPRDQVEAQRQKPRELKQAFHQGVCWEYHAALAGIVFGIPFKTNPAPMLPYKNISSNAFANRLFFKPRDLDVIDVEPVSSPKNVKYLDFPK